MRTRISIVVAIAAAAACAAPANPGLRADFAGKTRPSADVDWADTHFVGAGDLELYAQRWRAKDREAKAVVVIHHGLADHSTRYAEFAEQLARAGYTVWAYDMRGHGRSAGARVSFKTIDPLLDDLDAFLALVRQQEPGRPVFLYGHSLGGLVTSLYTIERQPDVAGLVLASPGIQLDVPPLLAGATPVLATLAPNAPALATPHAEFSARPEVVREMNEDPLISQTNAPARSARAGFMGAARVWVAPERLTVPLFVMHGSADRVTAPSGSRDIAKLAGGADKTLRIYDNLKHDLLREPDGAGARVRGEVVAWLDAHTGGPAVTFTSSEPGGRLIGDRAAGLVSIEMDVRGELPQDDAMGGDLGVTAGLRARLGFGRATSAGFGYLGGLDVRGGSLDGGYYEADAHLIGIAIRSRGGMLLSVTGGAGIGGVRGASATHAPAEVSLELPAGPVRILARAGAAWRLGGDEYADDAFGIADEANGQVGVRLGRDRQYWGYLAGGGGPYFAVTYRNAGGAELLGLALGLDLWGGN